MNIKNIRNVVSENKKLNIDTDVNCPAPPSCDDSTNCRMGSCEKRLVIVRSSPYALFMLSVSFPSGEIREDSPSFKIFKKELAV